MRACLPCFLLAGVVVGAAIQGAPRLAASSSASKTASVKGTSDPRSERSVKGLLARVDALEIELAALKNPRDQAVQRLTTLEEIEKKETSRLAEVNQHHR